MDDRGDPGECPKCGGFALHFKCWNGCDDGWFDMYDEDPLYYDPGDQEPCDVCDGKGSYWVCQNCPKLIPPACRTPDEALAAVEGE